MPRSNQYVHLRMLPRALRRPASGLRFAAPRRFFAWTPASVAFPRRTATELYAEIRELTSQGGDFTIHNYVRAAPRHICTPHAAPFRRVREATVRTILPQCGLVLYLRPRWQ